jgi:hypothetical protein
VPAPGEGVENVHIFKDGSADAADDDERVGAKGCGGVAPPRGRRGAAGGDEEVVEDGARGAELEERPRLRRRRRRRWRRWRSGRSSSGNFGLPLLAVAAPPAHAEAFELPQEQRVAVDFLLVFCFFDLLSADIERREARVGGRGLGGGRG